MQDDFRAPKGSVRQTPKLKPIEPQKKYAEPVSSFKTPEQVSASNEASATPLITPMTPTKKASDTSSRWAWLTWPPSRQNVILASLVLFIAGFTITGFALLNKPEPVKTATPVVKQEPLPPKPTTVPATLTGLQVAPEVNQRPVVGVMIENSKAARPQSGLGDAGVVFEAIAEGGITRFLALYQDSQPGNIGPIRSARPYYVQWNEGFRAAYAHVGGSPDALVNIKDWNVQDLNQFYNAGVFRRESSRSSPHNVYSNVVELANLASQKGYLTQYSGFVRKESKPATPPSATGIDLNISSALYNAHYDYDTASNSYLRSEGGQAHTDANSGKQLAPNVVVAMIVPLSAGGKTSQGGSYSNYNPIGSGQAYVFQDGTVSVGTWTKASNTSQITFSDQAGAPLTLNPGQTWLTALSDSSKVTYR